MGQPLNLIGQRSGSLTVVERLGANKLKQVVWKCVCDCGNETTINTGDWRANRKRSCGCYKNRKGSEHPNFRHGLTKTSYFQYKSQLNRRYGLTKDQYEELLLKHLGKCAICKTDPLQTGGKRLAIDHCHETGKIRGLLCASCNRAIGMLKDNTDVLKKAIQYLNRYEVTHVYSQ